MEEINNINFKKSTLVTLLAIALYFPFYAIDLEELRYSLSFIMLGMMFFYRKSEDNLFLITPLTFSITKRIFPITILALIVSLSTLLYMEFVRQYVTGQEIDYVIGFLISGPLSTNEKLNLFFTNIILAPLSEEYFFRFFLMGIIIYITKNKPMGVIISSLAFSFFHEDTVISLIIGLTSAVAMMIHMSIYSAIIFHMLYNLWMFLIEVYIVPTIYFNNWDLFSTQHIGTITTLTLLIMLLSLRSVFYYSFNNKD